MQCVNGSLNMQLEFRASFDANDTRGRLQVANQIKDEQININRVAMEGGFILNSRAGILSREFSLSASSLPTIIKLGESKVPDTNGTAPCLH